MLSGLRGNKMAALSAFVWSIVNNLRTVTTVTVSGPPKPRHLTLSDDVVRNRAVFVIGDIHGCDDEFGDLITLALKEESDPLFVLVGDLVNKGPKSLAVVRRLRRMDNNIFSVRGNHDEAGLREIRKLNDSDTCYNLPERYSWVKEFSEDDIAYLENLPYTITIPSLSAIIVHGGLVPGTPLDAQVNNSMTNMRNLVDLGDPFEGKGLVGTNKITEGDAWATLWPGPQHVYFGHDARRKLQLERFATGLDTGCVYGGRLTGLFINGCKKRLSVNARMMYSPP